MNGLMFYRQYLENIRENVINFQFDKLESKQYADILHRTMELSDLSYLETIFKNSNMDVSFFKGKSFLDTPVVLKSKLTSIMEISDDLSGLFNDFVETEDDLILDINKTLEELKSIPMEERTVNIMPTTNDDSMEIGNFLQKEKATLESLFAGAKIIAKQMDEGKSLDEIIKEAKGEKGEDKEVVSEDNELDNIVIDLFEKDDDISSDISDDISEEVLLSEDDIDDMDNLETFDDFANFEEEPTEPIESNEEVKDTISDTESYSNEDEFDYDSYVEKEPDVFLDKEDNEDVSDTEKVEEEPVSKLESEQGLEFEKESEEEPEDEYEKVGIPEKEEKVEDNDFDDFDDFGDLSKFGGLGNLQDDLDDYFDKIDTKNASKEYEDNFDDIASTKKRKHSFKEEDSSLEDTFDTKDTESINDKIKGFDAEILRKRRSKNIEELEEIKEKIKNKERLSDSEDISDEDDALAKAIMRVGLSVFELPKSLKKSKNKLDKIKDEIKEEMVVDEEEDEIEE